MDSIELKMLNEWKDKEGKVNGAWVVGYYEDGKWLTSKDRDGKVWPSIKIIVGKKKIKEDGSIWFVASGLGRKDFTMVKAHWAEFVALSENPPAPPQPDAPEAAPADDSDAVDEIPF